MNEELKPLSLYKEVTVESYSGYFERPGFEDKLKISKNWVSYKKDYHFDLFELDKVHVKQKWDFKTSNSAFEDKFETLCELISEYQEEHNLEVLDAGGFAITLKFANKEKKEINLPLDVNSYHDDYALRKIANAILDMIPKGESYPACLSHQTALDIGEEVIEEALNWLKKHNDVEYSYPGEGKEGTASFAYPIYPRELMVLFESLEPCFNYHEKAERITELTNTKLLEFDDLRALLTYLFRGEKFCDGLIVSFIKNGKLLSWIERLNEIVTDEAKARRKYVED